MLEIINQPAFVEFKNGLQRSRFAKNTTNITVDGNANIKIISISTEQELVIKDISVVISITDYGNIVAVPATLQELFEIISPFFFRELINGAVIYTYYAQNYSQLLATSIGAHALEIAYVREPEGTPWLPGSLGGIYYPKGTYLFDGVNWVSDKSNVAAALDDSLFESTGFARYIDTVYTSGNPQTLAGGAINTMQNNRNIVVRDLPKGVADYYGVVPYQFNGSIVNETVSIQCSFKSVALVNKTVFIFGLGYLGGIIFGRTVEMPKGAGEENRFIFTFNVKISDLVNKPFVLKPSEAIVIYDMDFLIGRISKPR